MGRSKLTAIHLVVFAWLYLAFLVATTQFGADLLVLLYTFAASAIACVFYITQTEVGR